MSKHIFSIGAMVVLIILMTAWFNTGHSSQPNAKSLAPVASNAKLETASLQEVVFGASKHPSKNFPA